MIEVQASDGHVVPPAGLIVGDGIAGEDGYGVPPVTSAVGQGRVPSHHAAVWVHVEEHAGGLVVDDGVVGDDYLICAIDCQPDSDAVVIVHVVGAHVENAGTVAVYSGHVGGVLVAGAPEERLGHAAVPAMTLIENAVLSGRIRTKLTRSGFIDHARSEEFSREIVAAFDVRTAGVEHTAGSLSGGNLQKFIMGREIMQSPLVLIASQPTWGVDAGAAAAIHEALIGLAKEGTAVLIISQDLDELLAISDRISVIADGHLSPAQDVTNVTVESIGINMGGQADGSTVHA